MTTITDRIEKTILLRAAPQRVWQAITDARQFGTWFGVEFEGDFNPGVLVKGRIVPTRVDPEVAKMQEDWTGAKCDIFVERIQPMSLFSFRWQPGAPEPDSDAADDPMTLVEFRLEEVPEGTKLTIIESGFDRIPLARRAKAFEGNEEGWRIQMMLIEKYLSQAAAS